MKAQRPGVNIQKLQWYKDYITTTHLRNSWDAISGQSHTEVLLNSIDEHFIGLENRTSILQDGKQELKWKNFRTQLMWSGRERVSPMLNNWYPAYLGSGGPSAKGFMDNLQRLLNTRNASFCRMWEKAPMPSCISLLVSSSLVLWGTEKTLCVNSSIREWSAHLQEWQERCH